MHNGLCIEFELKNPKTTTTKNLAVFQSIFALVCQKSMFENSENMAVSVSVTFCDCTSVYSYMWHNGMDSVSDKSGAHFWVCFCFVALLGKKKTNMDAPWLSRSHLKKNKKKKEQPYKLQRLFFFFFYKWKYLHIFYLVCLLWDLYNW